MVERRFADLRKALLRAGVAAPEARRAVRELDGHFTELLEAGLSRGESSDQAKSEAHRLLGDNRLLVETFAAQPELCAWCCRLPGVSFTLIPLFFFAAIVLGALMALTAADEWADLRGIRVTSDVVDVVRIAARGFVYWALPVMVSGYFAHLAYRHRLPLRWPITAIALVCTLGALTHFELTFDGARGFVAAVVGLPTGHLLRAAVRAVLTAMLVAVPLLFATRVSARKSSVEGAVSEPACGAPPQPRAPRASGPPYTNKKRMDQGMQSSEALAARAGFYKQFLGMHNSRPLARSGTQWKSYTVTPLEPAQYMRR